MRRRIEGYEGGKEAADRECWGESMAEWMDGGFKRRGKERLSGGYPWCVGVGRAQGDDYVGITAAVRHQLNEENEEETGIMKGRAGRIGIAI